MAEEIYVPVGDKANKYQAILPQINALIGAENDVVANMANITAALKQAFNFFWVGFYRVCDEQLILGPFQGPVACTRIRFGKGVCGTSWKEKRTVIVPDVDKFPGHIACSAISRSELVVPVIKNDQVVAILDIDSDELNSFNEVDAEFLEQLCLTISRNM